MQTATILGVLLAALFSLLVVFWQYYYKNKNRGRRVLILAVLRFTALFSLLLLLINPKISGTTFRAEKQDLVLLFDNSKSMLSAGAGDQAGLISEELLGDDDLLDRFNVRKYVFGRTLEDTDSLSFSSDVSNISGALSSLEAIYGREKAVVVLVSDGNQTFGEAYEYMGADLHFPVFSLVVGDTTKYKDLKISQVNLNNYAFLNNNFPVELFVSYQGKEDIRSLLTITMDGRVVYREEFRLTPDQNSKRINTNLEAREVGLKTLEFAVEPVPGERNTINNKRRLPIEVIDEKTKVGIISEVTHPDIGALTKAIESNEQRSVTLLRPQNTADVFSNFDLLILYQPRRSFEGVYQYLRQSRSNSFTLTGPGTDWTYLNGAQKGLEVTNFNQTEEILPVINPAFAKFDISDFSVDEFPPLQGSLGEILITKPYESLLDQQIKGVVLKEPLLPILSDDDGRHAYLFGENIWKWRVQSFRNDQDFENFDRFINKIILYLTSDTNRDRLTVNYERIYNAVSERILKASYYDATFVFDDNASLKLTVTGADHTYTFQQNMILNNTQYEADLRDLPSGEYNFTITVEGEGIKAEGRFSIEDFNLEQLFISSDFDRLGQLSEGSGGKLFFPDQLETMMAGIKDDPVFAPTQKSFENVVSLIDFKILFGLIIAALTAEWFIRKYNGLI